MSDLIYLIVWIVFITPVLWFAWTNYTLKTIEGNIMDCMEIFVIFAFVFICSPSFLMYATRQQKKKLLFLSHSLLTIKKFSSILYHFLLHGGGHEIFFTRLSSILFSIRSTTKNYFKWTLVFNWMSFTSVLKRSAAHFLFSTFL
jgi:hypothetical protein